MSIPANCVVKTVAQLTERDSMIHMLVTSKHPLKDAKLQWLEANGYGEEHGPFREGDTLVRYFTSREHAETWIGLCHEVLTACEIPAHDTPMEIVPL